MRRIAFLMCAAMCVMTLCAQKSAYDKVAQLGKTDNHTQEYLEILTSRFGGRPIGSDAYDNAQQWVMREMKSLGYEVTLEKAGELGVGFNRGGWWGRAYGDEVMNLHFVTPSYTSGTWGVQRGNVVLEPRTTAEFNRMKGRLKGAWVLMEGRSGWAIQHNDSVRAIRQKILARNDSIAALSPRERAEKKLEINRSYNGLLYDEMIEAGVLGFVSAGKFPLQALHDRDVIGKNSTFDNLPTVPDIKLDEEQFEKIKKAVKERRPMQMEFDIRNYFKLGPVPYYSLVATLKGSKKPNEYVILGAHLDSFDSSTGAVDDGSGVSALLGAARMLSEAKVRPERTIVFIFFAGEEFGLLGSKAWTAQHPDKLDKISNMFNRDGGPMPYSHFYAPKSMVKEYEYVAKLLNETYPDMPFELGEYVPQTRPAKRGGTDATSFSFLGVPAVQMSMRLDPLGYNFTYGEIWHTESDILNKSIQEYQEQAATALALMALQTANASKMFPRNEVFKEEEKK